MKPLLITLFLVANVLFITQSGWHVHHLFFGDQPSVLLAPFIPKEQQDLTKKQTDVLIADLRAALEEIHGIQKGKKFSEVASLESEHGELYQKKEALWSEIWRRDNSSRELRDLWLFSGFAVALILAGAALYLRLDVWTGLGLLVSGFGIMAYWSWTSDGCCPLLVSKTLLALLALILLYGFWWLKDLPESAARAK